jgi:3-oxoacyl-[acyl-carrier protein] reductase
MTHTQSVALITGGSRGIGAATAKRLAKEGFRVAISHRSSPADAETVVQEIREQGGDAEAYQSDNGDPHAARALVQRVIDRFTRLDVLVNNAGVYLMQDPAQHPRDEAIYEQTERVNIRGVVETTQAALPHLPDGSGRIITIGSIIGDQARFPGIALYALSKAAVAGFARGLARDLGPRGITVNTVQPGPIDTAMNPDTPDNPGAAWMKQLTALGRYGHAEEVANAVAFLASPGASYITGATLNVDGGFSA